MLGLPEFWGRAGERAEDLSRPPAGAAPGTSPVCGKKPDVDFKRCKAKECRSVGASGDPGVPVEIAFLL